MRVLGQYITRGRLQSIIGLSLLTLLSMFITPLAYLISGTPLGLVTLRQGSHVGLQVAIASMFLVMTLLMLLSIQPQVIVAFVVGIWLPVWLSCSILRVTQSQGLMLVMVGGIAMLFVFLMYFSIEDVTAWWRNMLFAWLEQVTTPDKADLIRPKLERVVPFMNGFMAAGIAVSISTTVFLARWWQASLFNPKGFRPEFISLRLPKALLVVMAVCAGIVFVSISEFNQIAQDCLMVIMCLYVFQGLSFVHGYVQRKQLSRGWLLGMYLVLTILFVEAAIFLACLGVADSVLGPKGPEEPPSDDS